jgi:Family of unknown function (DUF6286)
VTAGHAGHLAGAGVRPAPTRRADRAARRAFHSRRIWPALLAALLLTVAGALTAIEAISALAGDPARLVPYDRVTSWAAGARWKDWDPRVIAGALALLGLIFLVAGLRPGRGRLVPLHGDDPDMMVGVTRRGLKGAIASAAEAVDGVSSVRRVRLRRHKAKVVAATAMHEPHDLPGTVRDAVRRRLEEVGPMPGRRVAVKIRTPKG